MDENKSLPAAESTALETANSNQYVPTMWNDPKKLASAYKAAQYLASSELVPEQTYRNKPQNCLAALDLANRMNLAPLLVMQNLYIVKGKPGWSGQFCVAAINGCGRFTPLDFVWDEEGGCYAQATRIADNHLCVGTKITWAMVKAEGWYDKSGSKWKTMPQQMFQYRAAAFFARTFCPDILMGIYTADELRDSHGYDDDKPKKEVIKVSFEE